MYTHYCIILIIQAEKLARDPMRYVRNPSKLVYRSTTTSTRSCCRSFSRHLNNNIKSSLSCGFDKRLVSKDANGQECCFQEGRARAQVLSLGDGCHPVF